MEIFGFESWYLVKGIQRWKENLQAYHYARRHSKIVHIFEEYDFS
jgi:hypothetical protein